MAEPDPLSAASFDTPIGVCAVVWSAVGITRFLLPEPTAERTRAVMLRSHGREIRETEPAGATAAAIAGVRAHLDGDIDDLRWIALDQNGISKFDLAVYRVTRDVDPGHTLSYGQVAALIGSPGAAQGVGRALGRNPIPLIVPCHRILAADHALHGFSAPGGLATKQRLLELELTPGFGEPTLF